MEQRQEELSPFEPIGITLFRTSAKDVSGELTGKRSGASPQMYARLRHRIVDIIVSGR
jgi:hypothetical protein